jgi:hypothetical protein
MSVILTNFAYLNKQYSINSKPHDDFSVAILEQQQFDVKLMVDLCLTYQLHG